MGDAVLPVRVASGSIVLRPFAPVDAPRVAQLCGEREVAETTELVPHPYPAALAEDWIAHLPSPCVVADAYTYAVLRREDELLVGAVALRPVPGALDTLGYWIGRPYWRRGYATAAAAAVIALGFTRLELEEMHAVHLARNPASGRVMEKCGMREVRRVIRAHRGGAQEPFCVWSIDRGAWRSAIDG